MTIHDFMLYSSAGNYENIIVRKSYDDGSIDVYRGIYEFIPGKYDYTEVKSFDLQTEPFDETYMCFNIDANLQS